MAFSHKDLLDQLDMLKRKNRNYLSAPNYQEFMPSAIPGIPARHDNSLINQGIDSAMAQNDDANQINAVKIQNERDYQTMLQAQQQLEQAKANLQKAQKLKALSANYSGGGNVNISGVGRGNKNSVGTTAEGGSINVPAGKFVDQTPFQIDAGLGTFNWKGRSLTLNRSVADNFLAFLNALSKTGYRVTSLGSYANRNIAGTNTKSLHAYGLAVDINPTQNPVAYDKVITNLPAGIGRLAAKYGLVWGGSWNGSKKDPMHFSVPYGGIK